MLRTKVVGRITNNFELRNRNGQNYAIMRISSMRDYTSKDDNNIYDYVSLKVTDALAEKCVKHLGKGSRIVATGNLETIIAPDDDGKMRQAGFLIKAYEVEFIKTKAQETPNPIKGEENTITKGDFA